jgi:hypothetical protein
MANSYKITQVSSQPPRAWDGPKGTVWYIKVRLEGHPKAVSIGKLAPDALKVGDTVYGTITEDPMHDEDKFKADQNPSFSGSASVKSAGGAKAFDERSMYTAYAKDLAVALITNSNPGSYSMEANWSQILDLVILGGKYLHKGKTEEPTQADADADVAAAIDMFIKTDSEEF